MSLSIDNSTRYDRAVQVAEKRGLRRRSVRRSAVVQDRRGEAELLIRSFARTRSPAAMERLVELHLPLVRSIARRYAHRGERLEDLVQVGAIGLVHAIDRFDPRRGSDFAGYAVPTIAGEIRNHLRDRGAAIREPRRLADAARRVRPSRERLATALARVPTTAELALETNLPEGDVEAALQLLRARACVSLSSADDVRGLNGAILAEDAFDASDDRLLLAAGFRTLSTRERRILHLRFFAGLSQAEIAREVGLSQIQVSRLIRASLERLRGALDPVRLEPDARRV
jgi:RNA polymerase sigma-B factor